MYKILRLKFLPGQQKQFLINIELKSKMGSNQLGSLVGVTGRTFREWKTECSCIAKDAAERLSHQFNIPLPFSSKKATENWIKWKILVSKKGGKSKYQKYGLGTFAGRAKGGFNSLKTMRELGIISPPKEFSYPEKSKKLAEFVGIMLGDGSISHSHTEVTLNRIEDREYVDYIQLLYLSLFGENPKKYTKNGYVRVYLDGVNLVNYLKTIELHPGNKVKMQVDVPNWIKGNKDFRLLCARGLMDTDGCTFLNKYKVNGKKYQYRKAAFANNSKPLVDFIFSVFIEIGLHPKITNFSGRRVWLYNSNEVKKYLDIIGTSNSRLLKYQDV